MSELLAAPDELLILPKGKVCLHGIDFDEDFLSELVARHFTLAMQHHFYLEARHELPSGPDPLD